MTVASPPNAALSRAIDAYTEKDDKLAEDEKAMLGRLRASPEVTEEFSQLPDEKSFTFIRDCIGAHRLAHGGHAAEVELYRSAPDAEAARAALAEVERFFRGSLFETIPDPPPVPEAPKTWEEFANCRSYIRGSDPGPIGEAIALFAQAIDREMRLREEYTPSQKSSMDAADARALGCLRASVKRLTGVPSLRLVAIINDLVLGQKVGTTTVVDVKNATTPSELLAKRRHHPKS
jgi:hypothetical protein